MPKTPSITHQVSARLTSMLRIGEDKHAEKQEGVTSKHIYSWGTYKTYRTKCIAFMKWAKEIYGCRTIAGARPYVNVYMKHLIDSGYVAASQKTISNSIAKMYRCSSTDFMPTQPRRRADITRSRQGKANARFFESKNQEFVDFCRATGLRRHEITNLRAENIRYNEHTGNYYITGLKGKGGRMRDCPILSKAAVDRILNTPPRQRVWEKVLTNADIHSYRADYCATIYEKYARPIADIPKKDRYYCRKDLRGVVYDKRAMAVASRVLGHNRISVIANNYLYTVARKQLEQLEQLERLAQSQTQQPKLDEQAQIAVVA